MTEARRAAVLGHPIAHSLSPRLHRAAYTALGLDDWRYDAFDVQEDALAAFVADLDGSWAGLSLTMPLKQVVFQLIDHVEPLAAVVGAVNTVLVHRGGSRPVLTGANTDVHGIVAALVEGGATVPERATPSPVLDLHAGHGHASAGRPGPVPGTSGSAQQAGAPRTAAVLGAGATAASALAALAELGCPDAVVYVRSMGRIGSLARAAHRMGVEPDFRPLTEATDGLVRADLVVSTLPPGAADELVPALDAGDLVRPGAVLLDAAYDPRRTPLMAVWERLGGRAVAGERMLLHQAVEQVRLMTGRPGPLAAMDAALDAALDPAPTPS
ncbi:MAG TPA: shikimate dehydrogenase [Cellulomonas sp.]